MSMKVPRVAVAAEATRRWGHRAVITATPLGGHGYRVGGSADSQPIDQGLGPSSVRVRRTWSVGSAPRSPWDARSPRLQPQCLGGPARSWPPPPAAVRRGEGGGRPVVGRRAVPISGRASFPPRFHPREARHALTHEGKGNLEPEARPRPSSQHDERRGKISASEAQVVGRARAGEVGDAEIRSATVCSSTDTARVSRTRGEASVAHPPPA